MTGPGRSRASIAVEGLDDALSSAVGELARAIARRGSDGEPPSVDVLQHECGAFAAAVASHLERVAGEVAARVGPARQAEARAAVGRVGEYVAGWIDGGGLVLPLLLDLPPDAFADPDAVAALLGPRIGFVGERLEAGLAGLVDPPSAAPAPAQDPKVRLAVLLAKAAQLGVRIKNVPEIPSDRYLEKLEAQLTSVEAKRAAAADDAGPRQERLKVLLEFAERLKVRVKEVPAAPSAAWVEKMEAKLVEVALKKGVPLPPSLRPGAEPEPPAEPPPEPTPTPSMPPAPLPEPGAFDHSLDKTFGDDPTATQEVSREGMREDRRRRVEELLERAAEAGLELGSVPPDATDAWIQQTERKLDEAIERRKAERKAERKRKEAERRLRIERLQAQARELEVDLGPFPPFPTDDWLARAEIKVQAALLQPSATPAGEDRRGERLESVLQAAGEHGVELGDVPPDPDEVWLAWAESRIAEAEAASDGAIAVESEGFDVPTAFLVYEEGTVQEQRWQVEDEVTIGRGRGNVVQVRDDAGVSRRHCTIVAEGGRYFLRDEGSTKGTLVNGRRSTDRVELTGDEVVLCGETRFVFRIQYTN